MESSSSTTLLQNAVGTIISGSAQVINTGRDVVLQGSPAPPPAGLPDLLRPVSNATHTRAGHVARCDPGTRLEVIAQIEQWLNGSGKRADICWLNGPAGYGNHISRLIPTLAHQISLSVPAAKPSLERALRNEPALLEPSVSLAHQFQKLIIDPTHSTTFKILSTVEAFSHFAKQKILVIDALDECDDKAEMVAFIDVLINVSSGKSHLPFRILLTSRVEEHIQKKFNDSGAQSVLYHLDLANYDACLDIQVYFQKEFSRIYDQNIRMMQRISKPWPSIKDLAVLLNQAGSSFAFATTLIQYVGGDPMPQKAMQQLLKSGADGLDPLYKQVLSSVSRTVHQILGTIMILEDNQSISFLGSLLYLQHDEVIHELLGVQSIIKIPGHDDQPIMLYHTSLRDFLTIKSRSEQYFIDPPPRHFHLAIHLLKRLAEYPSKDFFEGDVANYACFNWPHHILLGFEKQQLYVDETMMSSLETLIEVLLTFQGRTWYNTILTVRLSKKTRILNCVKDGKDLFQVSYCNS
ncbi:hypothetical protein K443DRAFT_3106 [Laccaria amethystina LaAM-08-1]|uniref:Nephrocystin 3-like N-terminal domain-containing protein n=1 Tax=Laccaria amethystina LaAM-08-1 TaxID=1095629 RepID=A0A0C9XXH2_9AGAR|nr:hypothetical protein K443DRAFT_3106 [Laccaria amethystina LaAM-08-1]